MVNWILVGCGDISNKRVAPAIKNQPQSRLAAVVSPYTDELDGFAQKHGILKKYLSIEEALEDKETDAVYIATPVFLHHELALSALKKGKHVLVEKPMAMTVEQCEELVSESERQNLRLGVAYYRRFFPKLNEVKRILQEGIIGDVIQARIMYHTWYGPVKDDSKAWRVVKKRSGGGPLWDMGCHKFDMLVYLLGMPKTVCGVMNTITHSYEVEDSCSTLMEMDNGAQVLASFNWNSKVWSDEFEILGTEGKITMKPCDSDNLELQLNPKNLKGMGRESTTVTIPNHNNVHYPLIDDFARAVEEGRQPLVSGTEGYKTNRILAAIEESAITGKRIIL